MPFAFAHSVPDGVLLLAPTAEPHSDVLLEQWMHPDALRGTLASAEAMHTRGVGWCCNPVIPRDSAAARQQAGRHCRRVKVSLASSVCAGISDSADMVCHDLCTQMEAHGWRLCSSSARDSGMTFIFHKAPPEPPSPEPPEPPSPEPPPTGRRSPDDGRGEYTALLNPFGLYVPTDPLGDDAR